MLAAAMDSTSGGAEIRQGLIDTAESITGTPTIMALVAARDLGLVSIESLAPRPEDVVHLAAVRGVLQDAGHSTSTTLTSGAVEVRWPKSMTLLEKGRSLPLFDDAMGDLVGAALTKECSYPAGRLDSAWRRIVGLTERLPTFPAATLSEVIDIRRELEEPLIRFRREVVRLSAEMAQHALDADFATDVDREWHATVRPALTEIDDLVSGNHYTREPRESIRSTSRAMTVGGGGVLGVTGDTLHR